MMFRNIGHLCLALYDYLNQYECDFLMTKINFLPVLLTIIFFTPDRSGFVLTIKLADYPYMTRFKLSTVIQHSWAVQQTKTIIFYSNSPIKLVMGIIMNINELLRTFENRVTIQ